MAAGGVKGAEKLQRARARLMMQSPWLGSVAASIPLLPDENLMAFKADGKRLRYRPGFFDEAGVEILEFVLANAALHRILGHDERRGRRRSRLWQEATDYAINALLDENGFLLPDFARGFERYGSRTAESIYEELAREHPLSEEDENESEESEAEEQKEAKRDASSRPDSAAEDSRQELSALEEKLQTEELRRLTERYAEAGELPEGIERLLPELAASRRDWRQELHRFFDPFVKNDYRFSPPNAKHLYRGVSLPSLHSERLDLVVAVDSSGSVDPELLHAFLAEVDAIMEQFADYRIELIVADDRIRSHRRFESGEPLDCEIVGGGGTDFRPVFDYVERALEPPRALLYFTDGMGIFPAEEPLYETLWVLAGESQPPFGKCLTLDRSFDE